ncbi:hypothetical protein [Rathayibacter sp. VKM Ac-2927]|uniref:hypothetical protein n=1 Tax=Rathayibacter sp. VKM Ac-2927 TaxID=2929478 RepID=UPI001FB325C9|nr:hypothetical protein [Rathayibacter sp. VKM Ac-2927]MCJ1687861.1 hypothetical protein [Rathayibacter sp. VKM Ac-2927]
MSETVLIAVIALGGPLVGFLGSIAGTVFVPALLDRNERKRLQADAVREKMWGFQEIGYQLLIARRDHDEKLTYSLRQDLQVSEFRLTSLLQGDTEPLADVVVDVGNALTVKSFIDATKAMAALQSVGPPWLRGTLDASTARREYFVLAAMQLSEADGGGENTQAA